MTRVATVPLLVLLAGCYFGKTKDESPYDRSLVAKIEVGKTTKAQVLQLLGAPKQVIRLLESEAYMYTHTIQKDTGTYLIIFNMRRQDTQYDAITVIINRQDIVTAVGSRFAAEQSEYGFPFED
jgi:outer membrane protein assembly factor BamE (lipoprotein component of BamABCDE complex)